MRTQLVLVKTELFPDRDGPGFEDRVRLAFDFIQGYCSDHPTTCFTEEMLLQAAQEVMPSVPAVRFWTVALFRARRASIVVLVTPQDGETDIYTAGTHRLIHQGECDA